MQAGTQVWTAHHGPSNETLPPPLPTGTGCRPQRTYPSRAGVYHGVPWGPSPNPSPSPHPNPHQAGVYHGVPWDLQREGCDSVESLISQASSAAQS